MAGPKSPKQRADLTYKANRNAGRHGWLRLTPAYSMKLVREKLESLPKDAMVLEPFSGSATTPLVAQELGLHCEAREINPFLVWFGNCKLDDYPKETVNEFEEAYNQISKSALNDYGELFWTPPLFKIEKWWDQASLSALSVLKHQIEQYSDKTRNLLDIAFCRCMISNSNAAFNHQSMSFKGSSEERPDASENQERFKLVLNSFFDECETMKQSLAVPMNRTANVVEGDSTTSFDGFTPADIVITSPPYANRMSYIRELRPYMYWLRFLENAEDASDLDWKTTGGTWGSASTKIKYWEPEEDMPLSSEIELVCERILEGKSGAVLSPYVKKYFHDAWKHLEAINEVVKPGGEVCYIVGNSTFSNNEVPTHRWYAGMLNCLSFKDVHIETIRKRNSNKKLFEFAVCATK